MVNRRWWDLAVLAMVAVIVFITAREPPYGPSEWLAWGALAAFVLFYLAYARARIGVERLSHLVIVTVACSVILAVGCIGDASFASTQALIYPLVWISSPTKRSAILANLALGVSLVIGYVVHFGPSGLLPGLSIAALSVGFSIAFGLWIWSIAQHGEERGRLLDELQAAQGELAAMHRDAGVTDERARLAREIHDTIAQSLTGLVMVAQRTGNRLAAVDGEAARAARDDIVLMEEMAREALTEARGLVAALTPVAVDTTLADALRRLATSFERETGVRVQVAADATGLDRELEVVLLRTAQEGLANVRKHAGARSAWVTVAGAGGVVRLSVRDDGVGPGPNAGAHGFGLAGMRDRVALVGGRVVFGPAPLGGALLEVEVPVPGLADAEASEASGASGARSSPGASVPETSVPEASVAAPDPIDPEGGRA
ncbi:sensor histidine kinase [Agromyces aerolatus]|uniref:sensor histidine kinase n=1 Tax=Agromyces sp. LY-1074 TaxID=3074080 RepID=UPI002859B841|nr:MULTISPECIES: sensor histidine kinase [unclassified Agromyces]MDR5701250.1 sensor histidine kinase [Agromyces sp. LY-1074]MDR5706874.1 sensor histidine kinase [Agromyces sp. LY-1358]